MWTRNLGRKHTTRKKRSKKDDGVAELIAKGIGWLFVFCVIVYLGTFVVIALVILALCVLALWLVMQLFTAAIKFTWPYISNIYRKIICQIQGGENFTSQDEPQATSSEAIIESFEDTTLEDAVQTIRTEESHPVNPQHKSYEQLMEENKKKKLEEERILLYATMCERHAAQREYMEKVGLSPEEYDT